MINSIRSRSPSPPGSPPPVCNQIDSDVDSIKYDFRYRNEMTRIAGKPFEKLIAIPMPKEVRPSTPPKVLASTTVMSYKQVLVYNINFKALLLCNLK